MPETLIAERLLNLRLGKKLMQKEMANALGLSVHTYRCYEYGKRTPPKLAMAELIRRVEAEEAKP